MNKLKVKKETNAKRCEICHQSDLYDPINNICSRCDQHSLSQIVIKDEVAEFENYINQEEIEIIRKNEERFSHLSRTIKKLQIVLYFTIYGISISPLIIGLICLIFNFDYSLSICFLTGGLSGFFLGIYKSESEKFDFI